jgi:formylglycine-generating enzyme required for sulfatase activity
MDMNRPRGNLTAIGLLLGLVAVGCGDKQAGEIMIGISTNMSLPKDVSAIRIQVLAHGEHLHDKVYNVGPGEDREKLPGSLAVIQGDDETMPVTMKVIALQGPERTARVVAKAVSTVPSERVALLNLPVDWLCDGTARSTGDTIDPDYESNCGDGMVCVAGDCVSTKVDASSLGDYEPAKLFGGGTGEGDGTCFDTQSCFAEAAVPLLSLSDCTFDAPAGSLNVAVQTEGDGICGASGCLVPLDLSASGAGWRESGGKVHLPSKVCELVQNGKALGVTVSTTCATKTSSTPTCGPWSSVGGSATPEGEGPATLATAQANPIAIAVAAGRVYWLTGGVAADANKQPTGLGQLRSTALLGGTPTLNADKVLFPRELIAAGSSLFFTAYGSKSGQATGEIWRFTSDKAIRFLSGLNAPDGISAYWTASSATWTTHYTAFNDGLVQRYIEGGEPQTLVGEQRGPIRVAMSPDRKYLVWLNEGTIGLADGSVQALLNGEPLIVAENQARPRSLVVDDMGVCWTTLGLAGLNGEGEVHCVAFSSGKTPAQPITATGQSGPLGVAMDADTVYWTNRGDGTVRKMPRAGGVAPTTAAHGQHNPGAISLHEGVLYWVNEGDLDKATGSIMSLSAETSGAANPCAGMTCTTPPAGLCTDATHLTTYAASGTCSEGACEYASTITACASVCSAGVCSGTCVPGAQQCGGAGDLVPQTCDASGTWQSAEACPYVCSGGACAGECTPDAVQCNGLVVETCDTTGTWQETTTCSYVCASGACSGACAPGAQQCSGLVPQTCDASGAWQSGEACPSDHGTPSCTGGACAIACDSDYGDCDGDSTNGCETNTSMSTSHCGACGVACAGGQACFEGACIAAASCVAGGPGQTDCGLANDEDCCTSLLVSGGTVQLDGSHSATVSDYRLDKYEATVGRFRRFVDAWVGGWRPMVGAGKHAHLNAGSGLSDGGSGYEPGWDTAWSASLAVTAPEWDTKLSCHPTYQTWTSTAGANEKRPVNCATWFEQNAFCIWDGGFLPSEAEWQYAAAGGSENRQYPWGSTTPTDVEAVFCGGSCNSTQDVGSRPVGDGRWGHSDLAGNVWEWTLDWHSPYPPTSEDYVSVLASSYRVIRGGSFFYNASTLLASYRGTGAPSSRPNNVGVRCARSPL